MICCVGVYDFRYGVYEYDKIFCYDVFGRSFVGDDVYARYYCFVLFGCSLCDFGVVVYDFKDI